MLSINNQLWTSAAKSLKVWDIETMSQLSEIIEKIGNIKAMCFWKERNLILTAMEKAIMMWDVVSLTNIDSLKVNMDNIRALQMVPETSLLFAGGKN